MSEEKKKKSLDTARDESNNSEKKKEEKAPKEELPQLKSGMTVRVHQKIKEVSKGKEKERVQIFEGMILAYKKGKKPSPTITVRKISHGIGVEKVFPVLSPTIVKIEPIKQAKARRAKLYYLRTYKKRLKEKKIGK